MHIYITKICQGVLGKIHVHNKLEVSVSPLNGVVTHDPLNNFVTVFYSNICNWFVASNNKSKIIINPNDANNFPKFYLLWHYGRDSMDGCYIIKNAYRFTVPKTQQILENRSTFSQKLVFIIKYMTVKTEEFNGLFLSY